MHLLNRKIDFYIDVWAWAVLFNVEHYVDVSDEGLCISFLCFHFEIEIKPY
jgi:hypothetical protein